MRRFSRFALALALAVVWDWAPELPPIPPDVASAQGPTPYSYKAALLQSAQTATNSPTLPCGPAQGPPCTLDTGQANIVVFQVTGTFTGLTLNFDGTLDGTNYFALTCYTLDSATALSSVTATGISRCNVNGIPNVRARVSGISTGSVTVVANGVNSNVAPRDTSQPAGAVTGLIRSTQTTAPTCGASNGIGGMVTATGSCNFLSSGQASGGGSDSVMRVVLGPTYPTGQGTPGNLVFTFNATAGSVPACVASYDSAGKYGYYIYAVTPTTTTVTVKLGTPTSVVTPAQASFTAFDAVSVICAGGL